MPKSNAERVREYRIRRREAGEPDSSRRNRKEHRRAWKLKLTKNGPPFVGCDGEGCGTDDQGRQNYTLFRMGEMELYTGHRLTTEQLLEFICNAPNGRCYVGFAFGYDVTMILRDLPPSQIKRLFEPKVFGEGYSPFVWYKDFDIDYLPRNYLRVRRVRIERDPQTGQEKRIAIKGSTRTIYEVFGLFQKSFLKVLSEFSVGLEHLETIAAQKEARADFTEITPEIRDYCRLECEYLAELMENLRGFCHEAEIYPKNWAGAGKLSKALHRQHGTPKGADVRQWVPPEVEAYANMAYYGGRFEITRTGYIGGPVHEYDINSAYPAAMGELPCLEHGTWEHTKDRASIRDHPGLYLGSVRFRHKVGATDFGWLGGLPVRTKEGHLYWPVAGGGVYWSPEIHSAEALGAVVRFRNAWLYHRHCDCRPFDWIEPLYEYRKTLGKNGPGYPIKLGTNGLYGALAQRIGNGQYTNMVWAGLITAITRAKLNDAIRLSPNHIVMLATDGVYTTRPLHDDGHLGDTHREGKGSPVLLDVNSRLGSWDHTELQGLFIVQPGLYWDPSRRKRKSRGLGGSFWTQDGITESFEAVWTDFQAAENSGLEVPFPSVPVHYSNFIGLKLAQARGKPETAGCWIRDVREISFDYRNKRAGHRWEGSAIVTRPRMGGPAVESLPHREFLTKGGQEPWERARLEFEEQPDWVDLSSPWKD